jgi:mannobiose 2-epimerase
MIVSRPSSSLPWLVAAFGVFLAGVEAKAGRSDTGQAAPIRERIESLLEDELTRLWYPRALDRAEGGFHQNFARDWSPLPDDNRAVVYQARMTWTAAEYARFRPSRRDEFLGYARHGIEYLDRVMRDRESGGFHWVVDPRGQVDPRLGDEKRVYGTAFVLYAASTVHAIARDDVSLKVARDAFNWLEEHAHDRRDEGYFEALTRRGEPILTWVDGAPTYKRTDRLGVYYGYKTMNSHIHLLEALAAFARADRHPVARERLREVHALVRDRVAVEPGALNLYLTRQWRAVPAHDSFGHDVETAYLLVEAADVQGMPDDEPTWRMARQLVDHALDWGWDQEHGGFYDKGDVFAAAPFDTTKVWWTQAEGLNALLLMHRKYGGGTSRYWQAFVKQWAFIEEHQLDAKYGGWFGEVRAAGELIGNGQKANQWKANYHTARAMMNVARMLREIGTAGETEREQKP